MLMLMTTMRTFSPPTLLCKALSGWTLSRLLSPRSCNLQVLHALSERNKSSILVRSIIPLFVKYQYLRRSRYCQICGFRKIFSKQPLRQRCWGEDFLPLKEFLMLRFGLSVFRKYHASTVSICSVINVTNHLDLKKIMHQLSWYVV